GARVLTVEGKKRAIRTPGGVEFGRFVAVIDCEEEAAREGRSCSAYPLERFQVHLSGAAFAGHEPDGVEVSDDNGRGVAEFFGKTRSVVSDIDFAQHAILDSDAV